MNLHNPTLGQLERLHLLGCDVTVNTGVASVPATASTALSISSLVHAARVHSLRAYWRRMRKVDRCIGFGREAFWESYMCMRYQCRQVLPARWFCRV